MRRLLSYMLTAFFTLCFPLCADATTWSVFVYMCGSDLETNYAAASLDIEEMLNASPSDEVTVVLQTGGANEWQGFDIEADRISRYLIKNGEMTKIDEQAQANMGDGQTLFDFVNFCQENFAAEHQVLLLWDHGGGSVFGVANDQNYNFDSISLSELRKALYSVYGDQIQKKPFEIIGFDACLMSTVDNAASVEPYANYMVASQELEPGNGWQYTLWLSKLAQNTNMSGAQLGKIMCDAYFEGCKDAETEEAATLSLIDLSKISPLLNAWNVFGMYALVQAAEDDSFYAAIGRAASRSENFSNSKSNGYSNMVDMGDFIKRVSNASQERHPAADEMLKYLRDAVVYQVSGPAHKASGLSCYYPFDSNQENYQMMLDNGLVNSFMLAYGLQHGFIDGDTANAMFEAINSTQEEVSVAGTNPQEHESATSTQKPQSHEESSSSAINAITNAVNHSVNNALQSLLNEKPEANQDPIAFISNLVNNNVQLIAQSIKPVAKLDISALEDQKVELITKENGDPGLQMKLDQDALKYIDSVRFYLATVGKNNEVTVFGDDIDIEQDWEQGVFTDNFHGTWPALDGHIISLETTADLEDYNYYSIPVILNGVKSSIEALYDFKSEKYVVLGARRITQASMPDKNLIKLKQGDKITTILQKMNDGDEDVSEIEGETFTLSDNWTLDDKELPDGTYAYMFSMSDIQGNEALSDVSFITIDGDNISYGEP